MYLFYLENNPRKTPFHSRKESDSLTFSISWMNFFQKLIFAEAKWDMEAEQEVERDKDITAPTDSSHIKAALRCLPAMLRRKSGTKAMKRREGGRGRRGKSDKPAYLSFFHRWKSLVITRVSLLHPWSIKLSTLSGFSS